MTKLESLPLEDPGLLKRLYLPSEQLGRLVGGNLRYSSAGTSCENEQQRCQDL